MTVSTEDLLRTGHEALERHDWQRAFDALSDAARSAELPGGEFQALATAAWFAGEPDATIEAYERAHAAFLRDGDDGSAAMMAFRVAEQYGMRAAMSLAFGWGQRAERLAADAPDSPVHGWLAWMRGLVAWLQGEFEAALGHYDRALELAAAGGDRNLHGRSLHDKGHALCLMGRVGEGIALMDDAMTSALAGEMDPETAGYVYCGMISACSRLADYGRAAEWTDATTRWCERYSITGFPGVCRVHRAELLRLRGSWPKAEEEARLACEELPRFNMQSGVGYAQYEIGELRRRIGDHAGAEEAYARAHEFGLVPQPGLALLQLARGKVGAAAAAIADVLAAHGGDILSRVKPLAAQVEIAIAGGDLETAEAASRELDEIVERYDSTAMKATVACARGRLLLARGDARAALPELRTAREGWQFVEAPYELAEVRVLLAKAHRALGDDDAALMELRAARTAFDRLGARPAAEMVASLLREIAVVAQTPERVQRSFMFTDIVKSTDLVGLIGDEAWEDLLAWHDETLRSIFASHAGEVVQHTGDGFFVAFEEARAALECAVAVQRALADHRRGHGFAPQVRIGIHTAEATRRGADYSGVEVHKAARIAAAAGGGEILASVETLEAGSDGSTASDQRELAAKGIPEPVRVGLVHWRPA